MTWTVTVSDSPDCTPGTHVRLPAALDEIQERNEQHITKLAFTEPAVAAQSCGDVRRLLRATRAALGLADGWTDEAIRLDAKASQPGTRASVLMARAQAHEDLAAELREAVTRALLGEEAQ